MQGHAGLAELIEIDDADEVSRHQQVVQREVAMLPMARHRAAIVQPLGATHHERHDGGIERDPGVHARARLRPQCVARMHGRGPVLLASRGHLKQAQRPDRVLEQVPPLPAAAILAPKRKPRQARQSALHADRRREIPLRAGERLRHERRDAGVQRQQHLVMAPHRGDRPHLDDTCRARAIALEHEKLRMRRGYRCHGQVPGIESARQRIVQDLGDAENHGLVPIKMMPPTDGSQLSHHRSTRRTSDHRPLCPSR